MCELQTIIENMTQLLIKNILKEWRNKRMNRKEAEKLDQKIREYLINMSHDLKIQEDMASLIADKYLEIIPDTLEKNIVFLNKDSYSLKPGNIKLNMKCFVMAAIEFFASISNPESLFSYIQLALLIIIFVGKIEIKKLNKECSVIVFALHQFSAYDFYVSEEQIKEKVDKICEEKEMDFVTNFTESLNQLYEMRVIKMENGRIALNESVWGEI